MKGKGIHGPNQNYKDNYDVTFNNGSTITFNGDKEPHKGHTTDHILYYEDKTPKVKGKDKQKSK